MILFVDDEKREMDSFVKELELSGYKVEFIQNVDTALSFFDENAEKIEILIVDIMMPSGLKLKEKPTRKGLSTGFFLQEIIREKKPTLPIIIFTNVPENNISEYIDDEMVKKLEECQENKKIFFFQKADLFPYELVDEIKKILDAQ